MKKLILKTTFAMAFFLGVSSFISAQQNQLKVIEPDNNREKRNCTSLNTGQVYGDQCNMEGSSCSSLKWCSDN